MALIKCPGCGAEISDKSTQCIKCGCPVKKGKGPKKAVPFAIIGVLVVVAGSIAIFMAGNKKTTVEGRYYSIADAGMKYTYYEFSPLNKDKTAGTYRDVIFAPAENKGLEFTYQIKGKILMTKTLFGTTEYTIYKNYLIPQEYNYDGKIPSGDTFDVVCTYGKSKIDFNSDGTVNYEGKKGKYKRDKDKIKLTIDGDKQPLVFLIYDGHLNDSAYEKIK